MLHDRAADLILCATPSIDATIANESFLDQPDRAIEARPSHDLGVHVRLPLRSFFPDAVVRLFPALSHAIGEPNQELFFVSTQWMRLRIQMLLDRSEHLTIDIDLDLIPRIVSG